MKRQVPTFVATLRPGEVHLTGFHAPTIEIVRQGKRSYLWVGQTGYGCVGTLRGKRLRMLAETILAELNDKERGR